VPTLLTAASRLQKPIVTALCIAPLVTIVVLAAPAWISFPFLSKQRQEAVLEMLGHIIDGIRAAVGEDRIPVERVTENALTRGDDRGLDRQSQQHERRQQT
jgi:hypothetical protein